MKVLLSIKPEYAEKILSGEKHFEYRKKVFKSRQVKSVIVYATKPVGKVVGEFKVGGILSAKPDDLWELTQPFTGVSRHFFDSYFDGREEGFAIHVTKPKRYKSPRNLSDFVPDKPAPQFFYYLP